MPTAHPNTPTTGAAPVNYDPFAVIDPFNNNNFLMNNNANTFPQQKSQTNNFTMATNINSGQAPNPFSTPSSHTSTDPFAKPQLFSSIYYSFFLTFCLTNLWWNGNFF